MLECWGALVLASVLGCVGARVERRKRETSIQAPSTRAPQIPERCSPPAFLAICPPNRLSSALLQLTREGRSVVDLTLSNPTRAGFDYPADLLSSLADPRGVSYRPQPLGLADARQAVSADYARRAIVVPPEHIVLTASTSEAYSLLFKVLCDAGDEVLVPVRAIRCSSTWHGSTSWRRFRTTWSISGAGISIPTASSGRCRQNTGAAGGQPE